MNARFPRFARVALPPEKPAIVLEVETVTPAQVFKVRVHPVQVPPENEKSPYAL